MTIFKVGDKVKIKGETGYDCTNKGDIGTVVDAKFSSGCDVSPDTADWDGCSTLYFYDTELEKYEEPLFAVGDKVEVSGHWYQSIAHGAKGVVKAVLSSGVVEVEVTEGDFGPTSYNYQPEWVTKIEQPAFVANQRVVIGPNPFQTVATGATGVIVGPAQSHKRGDFTVMLDNRAVWEVKQLSFKVEELTLIEEEKVDVNLFQVGDKVKIVSHPYIGFGENPTGTVIEINTEGYRGPVRVAVDGVQGFNKLSFKTEELELIPTPKAREQVLEDAVRLAQSVFLEYMDQHLEKGPAGAFKASTNLGFATIMETALAYKAD
jgi:transcription antitermination factor NusG